MMQSKWLAVVLGMCAMTQAGCGEPLAGEEDISLAQSEQSAVVGSSYLIAGGCGGSSTRPSDMSPDPGDARTGTWRVYNNTPNTLSFSYKHVNPNSTGGVTGVTSTSIAPGSYKDFNRPSCIGCSPGMYYSLGSGCGTSAWYEFARILTF